MTKNRFRVVWLSPADISKQVEIELAHLAIDPKLFPTKHSRALRIATIVRDEIVMCAAETAYVTACGQRSHSVELDTQRTYAEAIISWLNYADRRGLEHAGVGEDDIQEYRNFLYNSDLKKRLAASTIALRVGVVARFFEWCQRTGWADSQFGKQMLETPKEKPYRSKSGWYFKSSRLITVPRIRSRSPTPIQSMSLEKISRNLNQTYRLIFAWALTTGLRRAEICRLTVDDIIDADRQGGSEGLVMIHVLRKGGKEQSICVLRHLIDETLWYIHTARPKMLDENGRVFVNIRGRQVDKQSVSRAFKIASRKASVKSNFHALRHTFALNVLDTLERHAARGSPINPLKTVQVLMGHSSLETTDIYLQSLQVMSPIVEQALDFLYGKSKGEKCANL